MQDWIYDIETYPNIFTLVAVESNKKEAWVFEISDRKDQRQGMIDFLRRVRRSGDRMVGFNNIGFDYPVLHHILKNQTCSVKEIYDKAMSIIRTQNDEKFANIVRDKDVLLPQLDLFKIHHFDNKARATSLKVIEFNMRSNNIEDLPFGVGKYLDDNQKDVLIKYNKHDVMMTLDFYNHSSKMIKFREELTIKYGKNFINHNDTKIGKDYFIMRLEEAQKGICYSYNGRRRTINQTKREYIDLSQCILPYVKFESSEFNAIVDWLKKQKITETKGVFSDLLEKDLGDVAKYSNMVTKNKKLKSEPTPEERTALVEELPCSWIEDRLLKSGKYSYYHCWNVAENLNVNFHDFRFDFGTGGIHGSIESDIVRSDDEYLIVDWDVASYYPNLAIVNRIYPEHLSSTFCDIYKDVYDQRKVLKSQGKEAEQQVMKLALNGVYGDSNNQFSPFYDPKYTMTVTINGQLSLCMLAEQLVKIDGLSIIQINTDGITVKVPRKDLDRHVKMCDDWMKLTGLELERNDYNAMYIRDVNNYIAEYTDGKMKRKGAYEYEDLGWHQNHSALVVKKAAVACLVKGDDIGETIRNNTDKHDFMLRVKVPRSSRLVSVDELGGEFDEQNICRYYASIDGVQLVKIMPPLEGKEKIETTWRKPETGEEIVTTKKPTRKGFTEIVKQVTLPPEERRLSIEAGQKVTVCNDINKFKGGIDYDYYIREAEKLVKELLHD